MSKRKRIATTICVGLALFATQFGAGNLIFPPTLGRDTGSGWLIGFLGFFIMDVGLAAMAVYSVVANREGTIDGVVGKIGRVPGKIMLTAIILCIGPAVAIPRTAATTYEMGIRLIIPGLPQWLFGLIFFSVVLVLVIRPAKVVDIIGRYLTPVLLAVMVLLILIGVASPLGSSVPIENAVPMHDGILNGYQTLDGMGGALMTLMLIAAIQGHGFSKHKDIKGIVAGADIISATLLALVYGGLTYLGATVSGIGSFADLDQASLLITITSGLLGKYGVIALTIIVLMACLTTAVGLTSVAGNFFEELTKGKIKYTQVVVAIIVISYAMSNFGLSTIISIAAPILSALYPPLIVLVVMALLDRRILNDRIACFGAYAAFIVSLLDTVSSAIPQLQFISSLPFSEYGLAWVIPAVVCGLIGVFFKPKSTSGILTTNMDKAA